MKNVAVEIVGDRFSEEGWSRISVHVPSETGLTIYVNHQELVTIQCTPTKMEWSVLSLDSCTERESSQVSAKW
ncbi:hypothetical protein [Desulfosporosinus shakirovi]|uniref:hypothetical protein n=1 Tax=Desulfosporosinus shakirovi TaxID=2885154 RepID=UPI001E29CEF8|nr:hypothetical protein [Desulfosporosinus sp. SRJS8]MCB8816410.1 hypothetical protein [Desulfosporosinus sp. SRJS8]